MRPLAWTILLLGTVFSVTARAQTYDPSFPVCMQTYGFGGNSIDCSYASLGQCQASASGRSAQCFVNPYHAAAARRKGRGY